MADATVPPAEFRRAVAAMNAMHPRPELFVTALDAPPRLAPYTWAFSVEADAGRPAAEDLDEPDTSGRLILLHDPAGQDAWEAAPSPRRRRSGSATSPGPAATTTWSCARRGLRRVPS